MVRIRFLNAELQKKSYLMLSYANDLLKLASDGPDSATTLLISPSLRLATYNMIQGQNLGPICTSFPQRSWGCGPIHSLSQPSKRPNVPQICSINRVILLLQIESEAIQSGIVKIQHLQFRAWLTPMSTQ